MIGLADRIQAIVKGRLSAPVAAEEADPRRLGLMMSGDWSPGDSMLRDGMPRDGTSSDRNPGEGTA